MIKNFKEVKEQLHELAEVVNKFKSEAVQLRIVDLVFEIEGEDEEVDEVIQAADKQMAVKKRIKKKAKKVAKKTTKKTFGQGAVASLRKLIEDDFFSSPKSIGDIIAYCELNMARKFKANEFSGTLARLVRDKTLTRTKNADNQYEYTS